MQGFLNIFINRDNFQGDEEKSLIDLIKKYSPDALAKCKEAGYPIMFLTTTNEASRAEKVDFDQPFPRKKPSDLCVEDVDSPVDENLIAKMERLCVLLEKALSKEAE